MKLNILYNRSYSSKTGALKGEDHPFFNKKPQDWMSEEGYKRTMEYYETRRGETGEKNPFFGRHHTEETKAILREKCANFGEANGFYGKHHTEETKRKIGESRRGIKTGRIPTNAMPVTIEGVDYPSATHAAREIGITPVALLRRIKNVSFPSYTFKNEEKNPTIFPKDKKDYKKREKGVYNHSQESKEKMSKSKSRKMEIDGVLYDTMEASRILGIHRTTILRRCNSEKYANYQFVD